jgi:uncharacterized membrane protein YbhN (UPF0104 family)
MKSKKYEIIFFILGIIAVIIMLYNLGYVTLIENLKKTSWYFIPVIGLRMIIYPINAISWRYVTFFNKEDRKLVSFAKMLQLTISGYAINYVTPVMPLGGEPYRILQLKEKIGGEKATSSVLNYAIIHILSHFVFWVFGCILIILFLNTSKTLIILSFAFIAVSILIVTFILKGYKHGIVVSFFVFLLHIPFIKKYVKRKMTSKLEENIREIDKHIIDLYQNHRKSFYLSLFYETISRIIGCFEVLFIMYAIGINISFIDSIIISAETTLFANMLFFSPMQLGTREGGLVLALKSLGFPSTQGIFMGIVMRISELCWIIIGIGLIKMKNIRLLNLKI